MGIYTVVLNSAQGTNQPYTDNTGTTTTDIRNVGYFFDWSLLPQDRGAAPINWALINGEKETGVTTFFIDDKIDTGAIILNKTTPIHPDENAGNLHDRLQSIGSEVVIETLERIAQGNVTTTLQTETADLKTAYKLNKDNCKINWDNPGLSIHNHIRGLSPYPAAWTFIKDGENEGNVKI